MTTPETPDDAIALILEALHATDGYWPDQRAEKIAEFIAGRGWNLLRPFKPVPMTNPSCQHRQINNHDWRCEACGEQMTGQSSIPQYVKSAPNAAAGLCANGPDCDGGEGCTAVYIPDRSREVTVMIGTEVTYTCQRCLNDGTVMSAGEPIQWDCGRDHRGARIPAKPVVAGGGGGGGGRPRPSGPGGGGGH